MLDTFKVGELVPWWKKITLQLHVQPITAIKWKHLGIFAQIIMILEKEHCIAIG